MKSISQENTGLHKYGLDFPAIMDGDLLEFDPVKLGAFPKGNYVDHAFASKIVETYAHDLLDAYKMIENLEAQVESLGGELKEANDAASASNAQVEQLLDGTKELQESEELLAQCESQMEAFLSKINEDDTVIRQLREQVAELNHLKETVPQLEADVNHVLENLQRHMEEEGVEFFGDSTVPDEDSYGEA